MDKQSLSRFGTIVVVVLILSLMIAFATPFGSFVVNGVKDSLFGFNDFAIDKLKNPDVDVSFGGGGSGSGSKPLAAGLYETGTNYSVMLMSWDDLIANNILSSNGVVQSTSQLTGDLVISDALTEIPDNAYASCSSLTSVIIPNGVTSIGNGAFGYSSNLLDITIPLSVTSIGNGICYQMGIKNVHYAGTMQQWIDLLTASGILSSHLGSRTSGYLILCSDGVVLENRTMVPTPVNPDIGNSVGGSTPPTAPGLYDSENKLLASWNTLTTIYNINASADYSDYGIFENTACPGFALRAYSDLQGGATLIIDDVTKIGDNAFREVNNLKTVIISDGVTQIGSYAFFGCKNLTNITIPDDVTTIKTQAFSWCDSLNNIVFQGTTTQWQAISFGSNWSSGMPSTYTITCTDGTIDSNGNVTPNS